MTIEKLTTEERVAIRHRCGEKALRIIDQLTAECERLLAAVTDECSLRVQATDAAYDLQTKLAAANALLEQCYAFVCTGKRKAELYETLRVYDDGSLWRDEPHLAGQAAPVRQKCPECAAPPNAPDDDWHRCSTCIRKPTRTEAEQRVLDAMAVVKESVLRAHGRETSASVWTEPSRAELARRGLKP